MPFNTVGTVMYQWSNGSFSQMASGLCATQMYTVTITDSIGCTATTAVTMPNPLRFHVNVTTPPSCQTCCDGVANIVVDSACTFPVTYMWSPPNTTGPSYNSLCGNMSYTVCVTDACGCTSCNGFTPGFSTGLPQLTADLPKLDVSPNPFTSTLDVKLPELQTNAVLELSDLTGRLLRRIDCSGLSHITLSREGLARGTYLLSWKVNDKPGATTKIMAE